MSGRVCKENVLIRLGWRKVKVAKVRESLRIELYPEIQSFDLQVFQVDVSPQIQRVKIFDADRCQQAIDLAQLLSSLRVKQFQTQHLDRLRCKRRVEIADLSPNAVPGERVFNLSGHVAIDIAEAVSE